MKMGLDLVFMLVSVVASCIEGMIDGYKHKRGDKIRHGLSAFVRGLFAGVFTTYLFEWSVYWVIYWFMLLVAYWVFFDPMFNMAAGNKWWYVGRTATTDRFWHWTMKGHADGFVVMVTKLALLFFLTMAYITV